MKEIPLTQGKVALVDDEDFEALSKFKWYANRIGRTYYALRDRGQKLMHREILYTTLHVHHRNGNGLDNQKKNLRIATHRDLRNQRKQKGRTSIFKGVCWDRTRGKWDSYIRNGDLLPSGRLRLKHLGLYDSEEEAAKAYDKAARESFGEFAKLNFPAP